MKKLLFAQVVTLALLTACGGGSQSQEPAQAAPAASNTNSASAASNPAAGHDYPQTSELNIYNWSNYVDEATVEEFRKEFSLKLNYDLYENNEALEAKVLTGKSGYDLVVPGISFLPRQIQAGAYQKIDKSLLSNYGNIDPKLLTLLNQVDPGNEYAVPYFSGLNTLAINKDKVKAALGTDQLPENEWDLVFKPEYSNKLKACGISLWDSPSEIFPLVIKYIGKDPAKATNEDINAAAAVLKTVRPDIKRFSPSFIDELARGDICLAVGNGGDMNMSKKRAEEVGNGVNIEVLTPKGMGFWVESWLIPADAKNYVNAHKYMDWTLKPDIAARNAAEVTFAPASLPARELMDKTLVETRSIFPNDEDVAAGFLMPELSPDAKKLTVRLWQELRSGS